MLGGSGKRALWQCAFNESQFRRAAADGSCGQLQGVAMLVLRRQMVWRLRRRLGFLGLVLDPIVIPSGGSGCFAQISGSFCNFLFLLDLFVICAEFPEYMRRILLLKKKNTQNPMQTNN